MGKLHKDIAVHMLESAKDETKSELQTIKVKFKVKLTKTVLYTTVMFSSNFTIIYRLKKKISSKINITYIFYQIDFEMSNLWHLRILSPVSSQNHNCSKLQ